MEKEEPSFSEVMNFYNDKLDELLGDPLLNDLPQEVTLEEVNAKIALEFGQAMTIRIRRADGFTYPVIVKQDATIGELKKAITRHVQLKQQREGGNQCISWRRVWKSYWLYYDGQKLKEDSHKLKDYGLRNHDEVTFIKRLKEK
uniref:U11/U12 small nuclear ribonucleoprotein 25 kDa protein-like n=1 Tax=Ciona intestinalis TaxID=7719 RepID=H2Y1A1_CIOIN|nr:U11/U12 small nuclear ribonucleoprotein 25 kDa protein-like [Ciona intestinalis]|eukprot:XP_002131302.1 U11/U12 small nuclear ribonucleoprotein 25 kDa protein-like [Ciona intestinalis]